MFAPMAKWVVQIDSAQRIPEIVSRAFHLSMSGRPGPVVVELGGGSVSLSALLSDWSVRRVYIFSCAEVSVCNEPARAFRRAGCVAALLPCYGQQLKVKAVGGEQEADEV